MTSDLHLLYFRDEMHPRVYALRSFVIPPGLPRFGGDPWAHLSATALLAMLRRSLSRYQAVAPAAAARLSTAVRAAAAGGQAAADALNAPLSARMSKLPTCMSNEPLRAGYATSFFISRAPHHSTPRLPMRP